MFGFRTASATISALLLITSIGSAQTTNASIYGSVVDSSGAAIPKAAVTATNVRTGVSLPTVSNDSGVYIFPSLQPGEYRVTAEVAGFRKAVAEHIQLDVGLEDQCGLEAGSRYGVGNRHGRVRD